MNDKIALTTELDKTKQLMLSFVKQDFSNEELQSVTLFEIADSVVTKLLPNLPKKVFYTEN